MEQNNLSGLFFPAVAGLFFFMKRPKIEEIEEAKTDYPVYTKDQADLPVLLSTLINKKLHYWQAEVQMRKKTRSQFYWSVELLGIYKAKSTVRPAE